MKIALVYPPELYSASQVASAVLPPLGIAYIAANLSRAGHDVTLIDALGERPEQFTPFAGNRLRGLSIDETLERIPGDCDWVGISSLYTYMWPAAAALAAGIKDRWPGRTVVCGGPHPSAYPELAMADPHVDYIITSEAEQTTLDFIAALEGRRDFADIDGFVWREGGRVRKTPKTRYLGVTELDALPLPRRDLLPMENYFRCRESHGANRGRSTTVLASRGCPYKCSFCTTPQLWTTKFRARSPRRVVDEIRWLRDTYGVSDIHFVDDNLTVSKKWTNEFCRELIEADLGVTWQLSTGVRVETVDRPTLVNMKRSGCANITFAPESGNERVLREVLTKTIKPAEVKAAARDALDVGMRVCLFFIVGAPGETKEEARDTLRFARDMAKVGVDEASFAKFCPLPGTRLFAQLEEQGQVRVDQEFYESLGYQSELGRARSWNPLMTSRQLKRLAQWGFVSFFLTSFLYHPSKALRTLRNLLTGKQETKLDRYLQGKLWPMVTRWLPGRRTASAAPVAEAWDAAHPVPAPAPAPARRPAPAFSDELRRPLPELEVIQ